MITYFKFIFLSLIFFAAYGCDSNENETSTLSENISWHRNSDGVFYGKTCIDNKLFVVSSASHHFETLSGIIGSCTGNEVYTGLRAPQIDENIKWLRSPSGISYFYTCIENHAFIGSYAAAHTRILSLIGNDCSLINK